MRRASRFTLLLTVLSALTATAGAQLQQTLFSDDFESGLGNWTATGLWNLEGELDPCGSLAPPFPNGSQAAWWGEPGVLCSFASATLSGDLTLIAPQHIPAWVQQATLSFTSYDDVECGSCGWDWRFVYVSRDAGSTWDFVGESSVVSAWHETQIDLTAYAGDDVLIRFNFDAVDGFWNDGLGWLIDDVRLDINGCEPPINYCVATPNSSGAPGEIAAIGSTSIASGQLSLRARLCPPGGVGLFFYGATQGAIFLGDGYRCLSGASFRLNPVVMVNDVGRASVQLDYGSAPLGAGAGMVLPGSKWNFSFWFRDPLGGGGGFNFTDGVEVTFCL